MSKCLGLVTTLYEPLPFPFCHPERSRPVPACRGGICGSADHSWKPGMTKGSWCFHEDSVMIGGGCGPVGAGHTNGAPQIPRLPGFPVKSCGFSQLRVVLFGENHIRVRR